MAINRTALLTLYNNDIGDDAIDNIINNLFNLNEYKLFADYWTILNKLIILSYDSTMDYVDNLLKFKIWLKLHGSICSFLQQQNSVKKSLKTDDHSSIYTFLFWPIINGPVEVNPFIYLE